MKNMIAAITTLIFVLISVAPHMDIPGTAYAGENEPEEYVVEKADSLWGISDKKLQDPFLWPRLWNVNSHINNPNLIYPGTRLIIPTREELLGIPPRKMSLGILKPKAPKPLPKLVFEFPDKLLNKYIIEKMDFIKSGWIAPKLPSIGKIIMTEKGSLLIDKGDIVYIETSGNSEPGSTYFTIKSVKKVTHPITEEKLGHQIAITGTLEIIGSDNNVLKGQIKTTFDDITVRNGLLAFIDMVPPLSIDQPRTPDISGYIIESRINSSISAEGDVIFLDKGSDDGVMVGDLFNAISDKPVRRPIGKIQVIKTEPATSTAIIKKSATEISLGIPWGQK